MKNEITIQEIIEFVRKAMAIGLAVEGNDEDKYNKYFWFRVSNIHNGIRIYFQIMPSKNSLEIGFTEYNKFFSKYGDISIKDCHISEREILDLKNLYLDCREYSANNTYTVFKNFFKPEDTKPININDLDNEDD